MYRMLKSVWRQPFELGEGGFKEMSLTNLVWKGFGRQDRRL
jgi:hypothetical protein